MTAHIWLRAEQRNNEQRVALTHQGAKKLIEAGMQLSVEASSNRALTLEGYEAAGAQIVEEFSWPDAPQDAFILGLKELPEDQTPLRHRHIMFGHAYKGQFSGKQLLQRFKTGNGALYDLEYLVDSSGKRVAAFGYWAGFAGAAVSLKAWIAQQRNSICTEVTSFSNKDLLISALSGELDRLDVSRPNAIVIGALGRVGSGATDLCEAMGIAVTKWDMQETASGGPFPQILDHNLFFNCILANEGVPQFVPVTAKHAERNLTVIGDIACDPDSEYNPVPVYDTATTWQAPVVRVHDDPVLDVMAIDNLPSMLPMESSTDFAEQLLPSLLNLAAADNPDDGVWVRARRLFDQYIKEV